MRRRNPFPKRALLVSALCVGAALLVLGLVHGTHRADTSVEVTIRPGMSVAEIARALDSADVVPHWLLFAAAARISPKGSRMQSGTYKFPPEMSVAGVIDALEAGRYQVEIWVPVPEGATLRSIAAAVERRTGIPADSMLALARDERFLRFLGCDAASLEGYLRPDTYLIRRNDSPRNILAAMWAKRQRDITPARRARMASMRRSLHEILTMASIVEGETRKASERARVAGVYYNRLRIGMPLQADPTIQYIISDGPRRLLYSDLRIASPYNTYRRRGLPPGPINNPGTAAIDAALYPETHGYLYFVADGTGGHRFSRNASEHQRAVAAYRRLRDGGPSGGGSEP